MSWSPGDAIVLRQVWQCRPLFALPCVVLSDSPDVLITYLPEGTPFGSVPGWPGGEHPWAKRGRWEGHGVVMLRRPDDPYSIWVFWQGDEREFDCWYVNLEEPYRRSAIGIDTLDHILDLYSEDGRIWLRKDEEMLALRVVEGRFTPTEADTIRRNADAFEAEYERNGPWWDLAWAEWTPPPDMASPGLPEGWELVPAA